MKNIDNIKNGKMRLIVYLEGRIKKSKKLNRFWVEEYNENYFVLSWEKKRNFKYINWKLVVVVIRVFLYINFLYVFYGLNLGVCFLELYRFYGSFLVFYRNFFCLGFDLGYV